MYTLSMREIPLIHEKVKDFRKLILIAMVDDEDYEKLKHYRWSYYKGTRGTIYAHTHVNRVITKMHRMIMEITDPSIFVDHINGNGLDNRKCNLRIVNEHQSSWNTKKRKDGISSKYKGVAYNDLNNNWRARITKNGKKYEIGSFVTEKKAALEYNKAAIKFFGVYAKLNIIED